MSKTITRIEGLTTGHWIERTTPLGTKERGEVRSVDDTGGLAAWTNGTQTRFYWEDDGLHQIEPPVTPAPTGGDTLLEVPAENATRHNGPDVQFIPVDEICPFRFQARGSIDEATLESLVESIRERGVLQPILVRAAKADQGATWELISGERRWRASKLAGLTEIKAEIHEVDDRQAAILSTEENSQRRNLGTMELC